MMHTQQGRLFCAVLLVAVRALEMQVQVNERIELLVFDAQPEAWLSHAASTFVEEKKVGSGWGCGTSRCVAAVICGSLARSVAQWHFEMVEGAVARRSKAEVGAALDALARHLPLGGANSTCFEYADVPAEVRAAASGAARVAALAQVTGLLWLGTDRVVELAEAAERALAAALDEGSALEIRRATDLVEAVHGIVDVSFEAYERRTYLDVVDELSVLAAAVSSSSDIEGGLFLSHSLVHGGAAPTAVHDAQIKRECWVKALLDVEPPARKALEVGFNAGHSAAMLLRAAPTASLVSYDLCHYEYSRTAADLVAERFPRRFRLECGDSAETLKLAAPSEDVEGRFDFVFIDGGHTEQEAYADIANAWRLAAPDATLVVDDCTGSVYAAWRRATAESLVKERHRGVGWHGLCIGRFIKPGPAAQR